MLRLQTPPGFSFVRTVLGHGWCLLPPFRLGRWRTGAAGAVAARVLSDLRRTGRRVSDRTIERRYRHLEAWAGIALWLSLTRDWFEGDAPSRAWTSLT